MKKILIAGGGGYVGIPLSRALLGLGHDVTVLDRFFFGKDKLGDLPRHTHFHIAETDIRNFDPSILEGMDVVIDLAGFSNDPSAEIQPALTRSINLHGCSRLATEAATEAKREGRKKRYIFMSSASIYGYSPDTSLTETSLPNPQTEYARCKAMVEKVVGALQSPEFETIILRTSTIFGLAPRMRFDLSINIMSLHAWRNKRINVNGSGLQWRPFIHVNDVVRAFIAMIEAPSENVSGEVFNIGGNAMNYQIKQIAEAIRDLVPGTAIEYAGSSPDNRSYNLSFNKVEKRVGFAPQMHVKNGAREIIDALNAGKLDYEASTNYTLSHYQRLIVSGELY